MPNTTSDASESATSSPEADDTSQPADQARHGQVILTHDGTMKEHMTFNHWVDHCKDDRLWKTHWDEFEDTWLNEHAYNDTHGFTTVNYKRAVLISEGDEFANIRSDEPDRTGWRRDDYFSRLCHRVWAANRAIKEGYFYFHEDTAAQKDLAIRDIMDKCRRSVEDWKKKNPPTAAYLEEKKRKRNATRRLWGTNTARNGKNVKNRKQFEELLQSNDGQLTLIWEQGMGIDSQVRNVNSIKDLVWHQITDEAARLFGFTQDHINRTEVSICETPTDITARTQKSFDQLGGEDIAFNDMTCSKWNDLRRRACGTFLPIKVVLTTYPTLEEAKIKSREREERKKMLDQKASLRVQAKRQQKMRDVNTDDNELSTTAAGDKICEHNGIHTRDQANDAEADNDNPFGCREDEVEEDDEAQPRPKRKKTGAMPYESVVGKPGYPQQVSTPGIGLYSSEEHDLLRTLKLDYTDPPLNWHQIAEFFPGRTPGALKLHWNKQAGKQSSTKP